jgi:hypothetical protein
LKVLSDSYATNAQSLYDLFAIALLSFCYRFAIPYKTLCIFSAIDLCCICLVIASQSLTKPSHISRNPYPHLHIKRLPTLPQEWQGLYGIKTVLKTAFIQSKQRAPKQKALTEADAAASSSNSSGMKGKATKRRKRDDGNPSES